MGNKEELISYLKKVKTIGKEEYQKIAELFEKVVVEDVSEIWKKHKEKINMRLNDVPVCLEGSAVNSSTALGFLIEEFLVQQLSTKEYDKPKESTIASLYDFKFKMDDKIELLVNLKVERAGGSNSGICAGNILKNYYSKDNKPKLYLIVKSGYDINDKKSEVIFNGLSSVYLESFLIKKNMLKSDSRNWSNTFKILSGRLQLPSKDKLKGVGIIDITNPQEILSFMNILAEKLTESKKKD